MQYWSKFKTWLYETRRRRATAKAKKLIRIEMMEDQEFWLTYNGVWILNSSQMNYDPLKILLEARNSYVKKVLTGDGSVEESIFKNPTKRVLYD